MKRVYIWFMAAGILSISSCGNSDKTGGAENRRIEKQIMQHENGNISLNIDKADSYSDLSNPSCNTAEWDVVISKSGRYDVWLSSATKDTNDLKYKNPVLLSVHDTHLEGRPGCDKIVRNSSDVSYPYFRADSFMGVMYIKDTGEFHVQIISEQILPKDFDLGTASEADLSKLLSISFSPATR